jgi:hypothetical protein
MTYTLCESDNFNLVSACETKFPFRFNMLNENFSWQSFRRQYSTSVSLLTSTDDRNFTLRT